MPTLPSGRPDGSADRTHRDRRTAESFGTDPHRYDRSRPRYPGALVERITAAAPGPDLLDVGCGTGIAARQFRAAGHRVLGVEPDERMAAFARRTGVGVETAAFEDWDPAGRRFDAVAAGTAWHWVDPEAGAAKAARVLRPGGPLALFWHVFALPPGIAEAFAGVYRRIAPDAPFDVGAAAGGEAAGRPTPLDAAAEGIRAAGGFGPVERLRFDWERSGTREEWLDRLAASGALTRLPPERAARVLEEVGAALEGAGGDLRADCATVALIAVRDG
ncbi:class I SAM-dependent methyltransferase [Nocardiopsis potens]|uniref:class I SAM-dependent methyltransferase n=1 Tax=Nocardiopsis potens TaxID=1246458 RepID=UPI00034CF073|nr:class I SAM-dependent methyltransferase [Nocardiopsis potens]